jgi:hypothetical protein
LFVQFGPPFSVRHQSTEPEKLSAIAEPVIGVQFLFGQLVLTSNGSNGKKTSVVASPLLVTSVLTGIEVVNGR